MNLSILYRGPLSSCNYGCPYCPFAKHSESSEEHENDRLALEKFVDFVGSRNADSLSVFFTPWGEALIHKRYQLALTRLSQLANIQRAVIQTNLSCKLDWVDACDKNKLALWATFHPGEVSLEKFVAQCLDLLAKRVRFSVGVVGLKENIPAITSLREALPGEVYIWVNAFKRQENYYNGEDLSILKGIDPYFLTNNQYHSSLGKSCRAGSTVISVDGDGVIRRCHFIKEPIGNIYEPDFERCLQERLCSNELCGCHIGYVHLDELGLYDAFAGGILERIPSNWPQVLRLL